MRGRDGEEGEKKLYQKLRASVKFVVGDIMWVRKHLRLGAGQRCVCVCVRECAASAQETHGYSEIRSLNSFSRKHSYDKPGMQKSRYCDSNHLLHMELERSQMIATTSL